MEASSLVLEKMLPFGSSQAPVQSYREAKKQAKKINVVTLVDTAPDDRIIT